MGYDLTDIEKPAHASPGAGGGIKTIIYTVLEEDIDMENFPDRDSDLVTITEDLPLREGKVIHRLYATSETIEPEEKKLKGPNRDAGGVQISLKAYHPGVSKAIQEFKAKHGQSNFFLLIKVRNSNGLVVYLIGEPYMTAWLDDYSTKFGKNQSESKGNDLTFLCNQLLPMAIYEGALDELTDQSSESW